MPRAPRIDHPHLLHHVIVRGNERRDIFLDDDDRRFFLTRFSTLLLETGTICHAWALMRNHFHLLLMPTCRPLSTFMRRLSTGYAVYFNRRHNRCGHLFQNRYRSIVCDETAYLLELVRYIHLNPLRAGAVADMEALATDRWCGHSVILGKHELAGHNPNAVLELFDEQLPLAMKLYAQFVADGVSQGSRTDLVGGGLKRSQGDIVDLSAVEPFDARILGDGDFVSAVLSETLPPHRMLAKMALSELAGKVAARYELTVDDLQRPGKARRLAEARSVVSYVAVREMNYQGIEVGRFLRLGSSGVTVAVKRGEAVVRTDPSVLDALKVK